MLRPTVSPQACLGVKPHLGPSARFLLLDCPRFVDVGIPLWQEDGSVVYSYCWTSPAVSLEYKPLGTCDVYQRLSQPGGPGSRIYIPQEQGGPVKPPGPYTGFPFRPRMRLAGLRCRYSNPSALKYKNLIRTSQETHYVSATETNRLMLFRETVAVYCENHTEHTDTVRTSQETHYVSTTEPNRLMLFGDTVAVYCENHTEHTDTVRTSQETYYISTTEPNRLMLEHTDVLTGQHAGI
jgi:hypothetical protein